MSKSISDHRGLIVLLGLLTAFGPMSIDMYLPAFPAIAREFGVNIAAVQYTLAAYNVGLALGQLLYGPLADQWGRKPNLLAGMMLYAGAAIGCAGATSVSSLIMLRLLQAVGGCSGMVLARAIVRDKFEGNEAARVFSTMMLIMGVAPILAPTVGSFFVAHANWRLIFWVLAGLAAVALVSILLMLPETLPAERRNPEAVRRAFHNYGRLLQDRAFVGYSLTAGMVQASMFAYITGSSFVFTQLFGLSAQQYGLLFGANASGLIAASQLNNRLLRRFTFQQILRGVTLVNMLAGFTLLVLASTGWLGIYGITLPLFVVVSSVGFTSPNATAGALQQHAQQAGSASALLGTLMYSCGAVAAITVSVFATGTTVPMAAVIAGCGTAAYLLYRWLVVQQPWSVHTKPLA
ncbi:Bcr/CflA family multidrug efflux MFS transporter [Hymenobacter sp. GOD-10R]|uniref:Bcr/CflA family multidrug efflux MFS transporter n=1 Tax=Hymenobacter sp. GOD-10R TaxID=3093922 RepID=UPI002D780C85|nr:Bcr/CflA family multidrug efflux MFS transporter [Hymenobacter sp. GOD-10R]WRQ31167.1 Bcr/CflA family multidrug efflux MFS transporter [Hymenobacter sp. GOD-10R]